MAQRMLVEVYYYTNCKTRYYWVTKEKTCYLSSQDNLKMKDFFRRLSSYIHSSKVKHIGNIEIWKAGKKILIRIKVVNFDLFGSILRDLVRHCNFKILSDSEGKILVEEIMLKGTQVKCNVKNIKDYRRYDEISILQGFLIIMTILILIGLSLLIKKNLMSDSLAEMYGGITFLVFILGMIFLVREEDKVLNRIDQKEFSYLVEQMILKEIR